jgi:putative transposase
MRFALIDRAKAEFPIHRLCRVLGVSQSGYFAWKDRPACRRQRDDMVLLAHVRSAFALSNGTYGSPRMTQELRDSGLSVGRRRTARLMRENGLRARQKRRFKRTTDSQHAWPVAPNLLDQDFMATRPDEKWGADISYVWTREGWLYLAVVIDLFARRVVGWATGDRLHRDLALAALRKALVMRRPAAGLIHHSDSKTVRTVPGRFDPHSDRPLGGLVLQGASGWPDPHSDRPRACLSADLSAAQERLAERLRLAGACDPRRA